ncbi:MAG: hypothetical protein ACTSX6_00350 [Candidatus Heimdallarchaeaceae archaeon]
MAEEKTFREILVVALVGALAATMGALLFEPVVRSLIERKP